MPEGHTLHRLARLHQRRYGGSAVEVSSPQGRFTSGAALIDGLVLETAEAWGKHLLHRYESDLIVHIHLGLYGKFTEQQVPMADPVGAVRLRMVGSDYGTDLRGPTACEIYTEQQVDALKLSLFTDEDEETTQKDHTTEKQLFPAGPQRNAVAANGMRSVVEIVEAEAVADALEQLRDPCNTDGAVWIRSRSYSRSSRCSMISMCSRPRKPQRYPKPSASEETASKVSEESERHRASSASRMTS